MNGFVINAGKDADHSVSAAQTPKRVDLRISQRMIYVIESITIPAGEIPGVVGRVRCDDRFPAE